MPFQGWNFIRNQNFTRDRNAGPPDHFISAEKVDDELSNIADGLTETRVAAATADEKATTESQKAVSTVRGGVEGAYDTLKKLYDWVVAQLATKLSLSGGTLTGRLEVKSLAGNGSVRLQTGEATRTGYIEFAAANGTRLGYIGYGANSQIDVFSDSASTPYNFNVKPTVSNEGTVATATDLAGKVSKSGDIMSGSLTTQARVRVGHQQNNSYLEMVSSGVGARFLHASTAGDIGFLNSGGGWSLRHGDDGSIWSSQFGDLLTALNRKAIDVTNGRLAFGWNGSDLVFSIDSSAAIPLARVTLANDKFDNIRLTGSFDLGRSGDAPSGGVVTGVSGHVTGGYVVSNRGKFLQGFSGQRGWVSAYNQG